MSDFYADQFFGLSPTQAADLAAVADSPILNPPITLGGTASVALGAAVPNCAGVLSHTTTSTTDVQVVSYTGKGVVYLAGTYCNSAVAFAATLTVVIDGVTLTATTGTVQYSAVALVGGLATAGPVLTPRPFNSSLAIYARVADVMQTAVTRYKWEAT